MTLARSPARAFAGDAAVLAAAGGTVLGLTLFSLLLVRGGDRLAAIWPANAALLAFLLRSPPRRWPGLLIAGMAANAVADLLSGSTPTITAVLTLCNAAEVAIAVLLVRRAGRGGFDFERPVDLARFGLCALLAPWPSATASAWLIHWLSGEPVTHNLLMWGMADVLGLLVLTPALVVGASRAALRELAAAAPARLATLVLLIAVSLGVFGQQRYPILFLVPPALILCSFALELAGAAVGVLLVAVISVALTLLGHGPTGLIRGGLTQQALVLQLFLAVTGFSAMPVASVLSQRRRLQRASERARDAADRAAAAAIQANRLAQMAGQIAGVAYWRSDADGDVDWSPQVYEIAGLPSGGARLTREGFLELLHPDDVPAVTAVVDEARLNCTEFSYASRLLRPSGDVRLIEVRGACERNADGLSHRLYGVLLDVTEGRQVEATAREAASRYRLVTENATDAIVHLNLEGVLTYASPATLALFGYAPEALIGRTTNDLVHPDDVEAVNAVGPWLVATGQATPSEPICYRARHADGDWRWIEARPTLVRDAAGRPLELVDILRDVTARKEIEAKLIAAGQEIERVARAANETAERYRLLAENATDMITRFSLSSRIRFITPACERILGYTPEELIGRRSLELHHPDDVERVSTMFADFIAAGPGAPPRSLQFRARRKDGSWVWLEGQPRIIYDPVTGAPVEMQDVIRDITARKEIEAELIAAREAAEDAAQAKADFLANMSHELRTPLNSILGFTAVLARSSTLSSSQRRYVGLVEDAGRNLLAIVNDVLDLSKIEAEGLELEAAPVDLRGLAQDCAALMRDQAADKGLALSVEAGEGAGAADAMADAGRLRQVLLNLIGNAVKFTSRGEVRVVLRAAPRPDRQIDVALAVSDTGIGIAPDRVERLFARFEQGDSSITRRFGGTGLGLSICRALVERMGGTIEVESRLGEGSTFTVRLVLPACEGAARPAPGPARPASRLARDLRLMVAEDVEVNQELIRLILEPLGCSLDVVGDGAQALEAVSTAPYDLILMDLQMPVMDGLEATRRIRALGGVAAATPIVALTANVLPEQIARARAAGVDDHVGKPFDAATLIEAVARWGGSASTAAGGGATDAAVLGDLRASLGEAAIAGLLRSVGEQMSAFLDVAIDDAERLRAQAHALRGSAGTLGFPQVSAACRALEEALIAGRPFAGELARARAACDAALAAIALEVAA